MAYEKQDWKDTLQTAKPEGSRSDDDFDQRAQKKQARMMYTKRAVQKDINNYIKSQTGAIKYEEIDRIGRKHGFYTT